MSSVPSGDSCDVLRQITEPRLLRLHAYLEEKRAGREFAARRDIDPVDLPYVLPQLALLDVLYEPMRFRYRIVGTGLGAWRGYDLTGKFVDDHYDPEYRDFVNARYRETVEWRRPTAGAYSLTIDGRARRYQALRTPLADDGGTISMIIAAFVIES